MNLLEAPNRGTVKHPAFGEDTVMEGLGGHGEVLHGARQIAESHVNELHPLGLYEPQYLIAGCEHHLSLAVQSGAPRPPAGAPRGTGAATRRGSDDSVRQFPGRVLDVSRVLRRPWPAPATRLKAPSQHAKPGLPWPAQARIG